MSSGQIPYTGRAGGRGRLWFLLLALTIVAGYGAVVLLTAHTKRPWCDETWLASPAYNLLHHGHMGTSFIETVPYWKDMHRYTYWEPPLHFLAQAAWYRLAGFGLFSLRALSLVWGLVALAAWYTIVHILSGSRGGALLAVALIGFDYYAVFSAADGRMDMMAAALHAAGLATYLGLRQKQFGWAVLASHSFIVASGLTHPNGIMAFASLVCLMLFFDIRRLRWQHLLLATLPYAVGGVGYAWYIAQNPVAFVEQFGNNFLQGSNSSLWEGIRNEIVQRYGYAAGFAPGTPLVGKIKLLILAGYVVGVVGVAFIAGRPAYRHYWSIWIVTLVNALMMALLISNKHGYYLVYITPFYAALLALAIHWCWTHRALPRVLPGVAVGGLLLVNLAGSAHRIAQNPYANSYLPVVAFLEQQTDATDAKTVLMGTSDVAFRLGFETDIVDDQVLGYYTGTCPDLIVMDNWCYTAFYEQLALLRPDIYEYTRNLLEEFDLVYENEVYRVYRRK